MSLYLQIKMKSIANFPYWVLFNFFLHQFIQFTGSNRKEQPKSHFHTSVSAGARNKGSDWIVWRRQGRLSSPLKNKRRFGVNSPMIMCLSRFDSCHPVFGYRTRTPWFCSKIFIKSDLWVLKRYYGMILGFFLSAFRIFSQRVYSGFSGHVYLVALITIYNRYHQ